MLLPEAGQAGDVRAWARRGFIDVYGTGADSGVIVLRDGVLIALNSFAYGGKNSSQSLPSFSPCPAAMRPCPIRSRRRWPRCARSAPFTFFVPTWVPEGLTAEPPIGHSITYHDRSGRLPVLTVTNGAGLADDPRDAAKLRTPF